MASESPAYSPTVAPPLGSDDPNLLQLSQWASRELERIGQRFTNHDTIQHNIMYAAPDKPRDGMIVVADGTSWNPGSGGGPYCYFSGNWVFLGPGAAPDLTPYLRKDTTNTTTVGYKFTSYNAGTLSSGTFTPDAANGNYQYLTNNGAHTWAVPAADSAMDILVTNGASAGAITFSGYTVSASTGDPLTTTNTSKFVISLRKINGVSTYVIKALQ